MSASNTTQPHVGVNIPSSGLNDPEKQPVHEKPAPPVDDDDEDIEDIDALIDDLESQDGEQDYDDDDAAPGSSARPVPEDLLQTDTRTGLTTAEVEQRRRKYGLNQMKEEKENMILKFLMYFVGPIQFVMEVRILPAPFIQNHRVSRYFGHRLTRCHTGCCHSCCRSSRLG